jgi:arylsulfatase A-like enzyme
MFEDATAPRRPSFNEEDVSDKPTFVRNSAPLTQAQIDEIDIWYRARLEALQAVDEGVERIIQTLKAAGELDNTYIIYTADNGWLQGEHRISLQKVHAYNESSRVPLIVRAPGGEAGGRVAEPTSSLDLTQTILDLAGARPEEGYELDGMSLAPYFSDPDLRLGRAVFVETAAGNEGYVAVTAGRWKYVEYNNGDRELYDLRNDRFEMNSLHEDPTKADLIAELSDLIGRFRTCNGSDCVMTGISTDAGGS